MPLYKQLPKTRKKKPDDFISFVDHALHFLVQNKNIFLLGVLLLLVLGLGVLLLRKHQAAQAVIFNQKVEEAQKSSDKDKALDALAKTGGPYAWMPHLLLFKDHLSSQKWEEGLTQLGAMKGQSPEIFSPFITWNQAQLLLQQGKKEEALNVLQLSGKGGFFENYLLLLQGQILADLGKKDEAKPILQKLAEIAGEDDIWLKKMASEQLMLLK